MPEKLVIPLLVVVLAFVSEVAFADSRCMHDSYRALVLETNLGTVKKSELRVPVILYRSNMYSCTLLAFDVSSAGGAINVRVLNSYPTRAIAESAKITLADFCFDESVIESGIGALLFEVDFRDD